MISFSPSEGVQFIFLYQQPLKMNVSSCKLWLTYKILSYRNLLFVFVAWELPHGRQCMQELQTNYMCDYLLCVLDLPVKSKPDTLLYLNDKYCSRTKLLSMLHSRKSLLNIADISDHHVACTGVLMHPKLYTWQKLSCAITLQVVSLTCSSGGATRRSQALSTPQELACITPKWINWLLKLGCCVNSFYNLHKCYE